MCWQAGGKESLSLMAHIQGYINQNNLPIKTMHIADVLASGW